MPGIGIRRIMLGVALAFAWPVVTGAQDYRFDFDERILAAHNQERATLGLPPLHWNDDLVPGARQWANHLSRTRQFAHSPNVPGEELLGENIWGGDPGTFSPEDMVELWTSEKRDFTAGTFPRNSRTGRVSDVSHYTQVMWRKTREVGCALSYLGPEEILVCRYRNPGNIIGQQVF